MVTCPVCSAVHAGEIRSEGAESAVCRNCRLSHPSPGPDAPPTSKRASRSKGRAAPRPTRKGA